MTEVWGDVGLLCVPMSTASSSQALKAEVRRLTDKVAGWVNTYHTALEKFQRYNNVSSVYSVTTIPAVHGETQRDEGVRSCWFMV